MRKLICIRPWPESVKIAVAYAGFDTKKNPSFMNSAGQPGFMNEGLR